MGAQVFSWGRRQGNLHTQDRCFNRQASRQHILHRVTAFKRLSRVAQQAASTSPTSRVMSSRRISIKRLALMSPERQAQVMISSSMGRASRQMEHSENQEDFRSSVAPISRSFSKIQAGLTSLIWMGTTNSSIWSTGQV